MTPVEQFRAECATEIARQAGDEELRGLTRAWLDRADRLRYSYHFTALGRPIIQYPQDYVALQELIWQIKPDLIVEAGIAHGGSVILSASMLALLDYCDAVAEGRPLDPRASRRKVLAIDIDIRPHNRAEIERHPMAHMIEMIEASSIAVDTIERVRAFAQPYRRVMVALDSNHTHDHVLAELEAYAPLTSVGSYCIVFDTIVEDLPGDAFPDRPWGVGDNPKTAVREYLRTHDAFEIDTTIEDRLLITAAPDGYLKRVR